MFSKTEYERDKCVRCPGINCLLPKKPAAYPPGFRDYVSPVFLQGMILHDF